MQLVCDLQTTIDMISLSAAGQKKLQEPVNTIGQGNPKECGKRQIWRARGCRVCQIMVDSAACLIIFSPNLTRKPGRRGRQKVSNLISASLKSGRARGGCEWAKCHIMRHQSVLLCSQLKGMLLSVRGSPLICEMLRALWKDQAYNSRQYGWVCERGSFDACDRPFSQVFFFSLSENV